MTFGEHLEELRGALMKAVLALGIGFVVGLLIGRHVVDLIQKPVREALDNYYADQVVDQYQQDLIARNLPLPEDLDEKALKRLIVEQGLIGEPVFVDPRQLLGDLQRKHPEAFAEVELPNPPAADQPIDRSQMLHVFLWKPAATAEQSRLTTLNAQEAFMIYIKASLIAGIVLASPFIFYFVWDFIAAGLYPHERRYIHVFMPLSLALFLGGAALAFFVVFGFVLDFLFGFNQWLGLAPDLRISEWLSFVLLLPIGFGLGFQLPLVMLFLERIGIFNVTIYLEKWRISVLAIAIVSMILTPADPMSMMLMAVPLTVLYFAGILLCRFMPRGQSPFADALD